MDYVLDSELAAVAPFIPRIDLADVTAARELARQFSAPAPPYEPTRPFRIREVSIPGEPGTPQVLGRIYAPADRSGPVPGLMYLQGGAFVLGDLDSGDDTACRIADQTGTAVLNVRYRLAPEDPYPAALDDCHAALRWMAGSAGREHGIDENRIGVLGESSGGGLAAALCLRVRDHGGPALIAQLLDAPTVDDRLRTHSIRHLPDTPTWQATNSPHSWRYYLYGTAQPGGSDVPLYAAPGRAQLGDLAALPPAYVTAYQIDPTRDEGLDYARLLIQAGVPTELHHYSGAFHVAHAIPGTAIGARMTADRMNAIRRLLHTPNPPA
ncbi:alpha/beta hydrolase [Streptomyces sp. RLB1-33]|nr:alpha/beta hydrolase [Streptomyces sp. RLB1-33]QIY68776.1 alpha/beta hydrolase [Streptomyces sp. RLB1-33]